MRKVTNANLIYRNIWGTKWDCIEQVNRMLEEDKIEIVDEDQKELLVKKFEIHSPGNREKGHLQIISFGKETNWNKTTI